MYQYNNPSNDSNNPPLPSARLPARPRFNGQGEEYSMQQTSYNSKPANAGFQQPPRNDNDLGYYESSIPGSNNMQRPLMATNNSSISTATTLGGNGGGGGTRFGAQQSNMIGGGPGDFGIAPRRQTRRYKTGKEIQEKKRAIIFNSIFFFLYKQ